MDIEFVSRSALLSESCFMFLATLAAIVLVALLASVVKAALGRLIHRYRWPEWSHR